MKKWRYFAAAALIMVSCSTGRSVDGILDAVDITHVTITDNFWHQRLEVNENVTIPHAIRKCYEEGRVTNFLCAAGTKEGGYRGDNVHHDSDVYKVLEGMAFSYNVSKDEAMRRQMDTLISYIASAQQPDGYLYTPYTLRFGDYAEEAGRPFDKKPFDTLISSHELYCMGHMYEAATAHFIATGQRNFLDVAIKNANLIYDVFGPGKRVGIPGHEEIEIGLLKLYRVTGNRNYLELAKAFMDRRGTGVFDGNPYRQDYKPVAEQFEAVGHAVRAGYLYTAMADYASLAGDESYLTAVDSFWDNVVGKKNYLTGGLGARHDGEAFGDNYELPNRSYAETCAAIAGVYWNQRMFLLHGQAKYFDVLERILYNGLISGISLDGTKFFYQNMLSTKDAGAFNNGNRGRSEWFNCSCCPTNDVRFISSLPGYIYAVKGDEIYVNLYVADDAEIDLGSKKVKLSQKTDYPWSGEVDINVWTAGTYSLMLRIPGWALNRPVPSGLYSYADGKSGGWEIYINGERYDCAPVDGYCRISRAWKKGDVVSLSLDIKPRTVTADLRVEADRGKVAVECGPLVYCVESVDNGGVDIFSESLSLNPEFISGSAEIEGTAVTTLKAGNLTFIPYFAWAHRGDSDMTVWLNAAGR